MIRAGLIALAFTVTLADHADARRRKHYRVVRTAPPAENPNTLAHCYLLDTFEGQWCDRIRAVYTNCYIGKSQVSCNPLRFEARK